MWNTLYFSKVNVSFNQELQNNMFSGWWCFLSCILPTSCWVSHRWFGCMVSIIQTCININLFLRGRTIFRTNRCCSHGLSTLPGHCKFLHGRIWEEHHRDSHTQTGLLVQICGWHHYLATWTKKTHGIPGTPEWHQQEHTIHYGNRSRRSHPLPGYRHTGRRTAPLDIKSTENPHTKTYTYTRNPTTPGQQTLGPFIPDT